MSSFSTLVRTLESAISEQMAEGGDHDHYEGSATTNLEDAKVIVTLSLDIVSLQDAEPKEECYLDRENGIEVNLEVDMDRVCVILPSTVYITDASARQFGAALVRIADHLSKLKPT